jgi:hypothetical protein
MAHLRGMKAIADYMQRSEATILVFISQMDFPAKKISNGIWESDTELADAWRKRMITTKEIEQPIIKRATTKMNRKRFG